MEKEVATLATSDSRSLTFATLGFSWWYVIAASANLTFTCASIVAPRAASSRVLIGEMVVVPRFDFFSYTLMQ